MILRALQLSVSIYLLLAVITGTVIEIVNLRRWSDGVEVLMILFIAGFIAWNNIRFDFSFFKGRSFNFSPPKNAWGIIGFCALIPVLFYMSMNVWAGYDSHLSQYDIAIHMPESWWAEELQWSAELILAKTEPGIFTLWLYIFLCSALATIYLSGFFGRSSSKESKAPALSWSMIGSRLALAGAMLVLTVSLFNDVMGAITYIITEKDEFPELTLFINVARVVLATINALILFTYSIWMIIDASRAFRIRRTSLKSVPVKN